MVLSGTWSECKRDLRFVSRLRRSTHSDEIEESTGNCYGTAIRGRATMSGAAVYRNELLHSIDFLVYALSVLAYLLSPAHRKSSHPHHGSVFANPTTRSDPIRPPLRGASPISISPSNPPYPLPTLLPHRLDGCQYRQHRPAFGRGESGNKGRFLGWKRCHSRFCRSRFVESGLDISIRV